MSLKAQLDICRCSFAANAATDLVAAMQQSIRQLTETSLAANAVKGGEAAPRFRLRYGRRGFVDLSDLLDRGPVVVSFFRGDWCPFCVLELKALAQAYAEIERLGATPVALSPQALGQSSCPGSDGEPPFPILRDPGCEIAVRYGIAFTFPRQIPGRLLGARLPQSGEDRIERLGDAYTCRLRPQ
jgi:peroxiredoxin